MSGRDIMRFTALIVAFNMVDWLVSTVWMAVAGIPSKPDTTVILIWAATLTILWAIREERNS